MTPTSLAGRIATTMDVSATTEAPVGAFPSCDDVPRLSAPAEWYRDEPIYVANEMPFDDVRVWAEAQPAYVDIWLDRDHFGWITVAFSAEAVARQAELEAQFPGVGVVAIDVPVSREALATLQAQADELLLAAGVDYAGSGTDITRWMVELGVDMTDERVQPALAPLAGERVCLSEIGVRVPEGPQPTEGDGWRLLGDELVGEPYRTGLATGDEQYIELWDRVGMTGERPAVDFESEIVIWFGAVYGSSCPIRLDDVVVDTARTRPLVHSVTVVPGIPRGCTDDANPRALVVAIDRSGLPPGLFAIQLGPEDPPLGAPEERTIVEANLSEPGAPASDLQIGPDPDLIAAAGTQPPTVSGDVIEPGYPWRYELYVHCGIGTLGQLNGLWWMTDEGASVTDYVPEQWAPLVEDGEQTIVVDVVMTEGPAPTLTATANGHSVTYLPVPFDAVPGCD